MKNAGTILIVSGAVLVLLGIFLLAGGSLSWLGRLPGDVRISRPGMSFFFPVTTCIVISIVISVIFYLARMLK
ncbi:DUF2905 domain-containing protein [archaeon]|nr:DUF2905 domain-containing protein [archaeon]